MQLQRARVGSEQESLRSRVSVINYRNIPRRANNCYASPMYEDVINAPKSLGVHIDATKVSHTMTIIITERERNKNPGDIF